MIGFSNPTKLKAKRRKREEDVVHTPNSLPQKARGEQEGDWEKKEEMLLSNAS